MFERVTRQEAIQRGLSRYFEGKRCKYGHVAQRSTLSGNCSACSIMRHADYRKRKPEIRRAYYLANKEKENEQARVYHVKNKRRRQAYARELRERDREVIRERMREWRAANPGYVRNHRLANPGKYVVYTENRRARTANGKLSVDIRQRLFDVQRGLCACCALPLGPSYHIDHIIPLSRGGTNTDDNVQLLTAKCNLRKGSQVQ